MSPELSHSLEKKWFSSLPPSRVEYPATLPNRLKYAFWRLYTPYHPFVRDLVLALGLVRHEGRQNYILGMVVPHLTLKEFTSFLIAQGYGNHFVAWEDDGEIVSLRYVKDFVHQYHVRVFHDREVRAHYEYTPECYPILHIMEEDMQARREEFLMLLGNTIVPHRGEENAS